MKSKRSILESLRSHYMNLQQASAEAAAYHDKYLEEIHANYKEYSARAQAKHDAQVGEAKAIYDAELAAARESIESAERELGILAAPWGSDLWWAHDPLENRGVTNGVLVPGGVRVGVTPVLNGELESVPALVPLISNGHLFILSRGSEKSRALELLQSIATRIAVTFPALSARFTFIDPLGLGGNFPFKMLPEIIRGEIVYTEADEIRLQMREVTERLRNVTQAYLAREFSSIEQYNQVAEDIVEPYRFVCIADFPATFDAEAARRLLSVAEKGVPTGTYLLMHIDEDADLPRGFNRESLLRTGTTIWANEGGFSLPIGNAQRELLPDSIPPQDVFNMLMQKVQLDAERGGFKGIPFKKIALSHRHWWSKDGRELLSVPIGLTSARNELEFWLGQQKDSRQSSNVLMTGRVGSGKSNLFHVLIARLVTAYSPEEIELYLMDFKEGVEFKPYADWKLPHARVIAIKSEREFGLSVLSELKAEMVRRGALFQEAGVQNLSQYRNRTNRSLPRQLLIVDEFQKLFEQPDSITRTARFLMEDIARRGRAFGIHIMLGTQSMRGVDMPSSALGQFATRIVLQSPEADAALLLGSDNVAAATLIERPGQLVFNDDGGRREKNTMGQVALIKDRELSQILKEVSSLAADRGFQRESQQIIFRGDEGASLDNNAHLQRLYSLPDWPTPEQVKFDLGMRDWMAAEQPSLAWLGEAIEIKPHTSASFRRRRGSNLLIVGDSEESVFGMLGGAMISLASFYAPNKTRFHVIDTSHQDADWGNMSAIFAEQFDFHDVVVHRQAASIIVQIAKMVEQRQTQHDAGHEELGPATFLIVAGGHRLPELRPAATRFGSEPSEHGKQLLDIIENGPELGVYTILWYGRVQSYEDSLGRPSLNYFDHRVALSMNEPDSQYLLRAPLAAKLPADRAYLLEEGRDPEKFIPYLFPREADALAQLFKSYADRLRNRRGW